MQEGLIPDHKLTDIRTGRSLEGLQILRGFAASAVVLHHVLEESRRQFQTSDWFTRAGAAGVDIFFVLSGFIMLYTLPTGLDRVSEARAFLVRRTIRIVPLYWLIVISVALVKLTGVFYQSLVLTPGTFLRSLVFLERHDLVLGVAWTLNYETYFYVIFAIAISLTRSSRLVTLLVGTVIVINILCLSQCLSGAWKEWMSNPIAIEFIGGMLLGIIHKKIIIRGLYRRFLSAFALISICIASQYGPALNTNGLIGWARPVEWGGGSSFNYNMLTVQHFISKGANALPDAFRRFLVCNIS